VKEFLSSTEGGGGGGERNKAFYVLLDVKRHGGGLAEPISPEGGHTRLLRRIEPLALGPHRNAEQGQSDTCVST